MFPELRYRWFSRVSPHSLWIKFEIDTVVEIVRLSLADSPGASCRISLNSCSTDPCFLPLNFYSSSLKICFWTASLISWLSLSSRGGITTGPSCHFFFLALRFFFFFFFLVPPEITCFYFWADFRAPVFAFLPPPFPGPFSSVPIPLPSESV